MSIEIHEARGVDGRLDVSTMPQATNMFANTCVQYYRARQDQQISFLFSNSSYTLRCFVVAEEVVVMRAEAEEGK
jgi:hypothetical protein